MFTKNLRRRFIKYIKTYPLYQVVKPSYKKPLGLLKPIVTLSRPFKVMTIDFMVSLLVTDRFNAIIIVTYKFSKLIYIIPGKESQLAKRQAYTFFNQVVRYRQKLKCIISNRDIKFTSNFQKALLKKYEIGRYLIIAYYPVADRQSKKTNDTVKVILRVLLVGKYEENQLSLLLEVELAYNYLKQLLITYSLFKVIYSFKLLSSFNAVIS